MSTFVEQLEHEVSTWPQLTVHPHRFGGKEFRMGTAEVGHVHNDGVTDIPFTRKIRDVLLEKGLADQHRWVPDSGWTTLRIRSAEDVQRASWLLRLSYLRYRLKTAQNPQEVCETECRRLTLSGPLRDLIHEIVPARKQIA